MKGIFAGKIIDWILPVGFSMIILVIGSLNFKPFYHQVKNGKVDKEALESINRNFMQKIVFLICMDFHWIF